MMRPAASRQISAIAQTDCLHGQIVIAKVAVEQRGLDMLTDPGALPMEQRGKYRAEAMNTGRDIADSDLRQHGRAIRVAQHAQHARVGTSDEIVAGAVGERPLLPEGRNRAHDDFRIEQLDRLIIETNPPYSSGRV